MMKKTYKFALLLCLAFIVMLLASCQAVFDAGLSGVLKDKDTGAGIPGMMVYAYLDQGKRDSDFNKGAVVGEDGMKLSFAPSGSDYIPATSTGNDGSFTISKLIWKNQFPKFGKTADYQKVYLLYFKSDYGLVKENQTVTIVSDSNNSSRISTSISSRLKKKDVKISVKNANSSDPRDSNVAFNVRVKAYLENHEDHPYMDENLSLTGNSTISVPYLAKAEEGKSTVAISVVPDADSDWAWVDPDNDYKKTSNPLTVSDEDLRKDDPITKTAFVKSYKFSFPVFKGKAAVEDETSKEKANDDLCIWLAQATPDGAGIALQTIDKVITAPSGDGANGAIVSHGVFSGLGEHITWVPDLVSGDYEGNMPTKNVFLILDSSTGDEPQQPDINDWFYQITINPDSKPNIDLGKIDKSVVKTYEGYSITKITGEN